jgi:hypothetical protein
MLAYAELHLRCVLPMVTRWWLDKEHRSARFGFSDFLITCYTFDVAGIKSKGSFFFAYSNRTQGVHSTSLLTGNLAWRFVCS